jgi:hypothetical protein
MLFFKDFANMPSSSPPLPAPKQGLVGKACRLKVFTLNLQSGLDFTQSFRGLGDQTLAQNLSCNLAFLNLYEVMGEVLVNHLEYVGENRLKVDCGQILGLGF